MRHSMWFILCFIILFVTPTSFGSEAAANSNGATTQDTLEAAYQREYAYLIAEKRTLATQLKAIQAKGQSRIDLAAQNVATAEINLFATQKRLETLETELAALDRSLSKNEEDLAVFEAAWTQARDRIGSKESGKIPTPTQLTALFDQTLQHLNNATNLNRTIEPVFLPDGTQVSGDVIRLGEIASLATTEGGAGALIPIGGGKLQLLDYVGADSAVSLEQGKSPDSIELYLYEGEKKPIYIREDKGVMDTIRAGGLVAWVIAILGLFGLGLAAVRFGLVLEAARFSEAKLRELVVAVQQGQLHKLPKLNGSAGRIINELKAETTTDRESLIDVAGAALLKETPRVQRFGTAIMVIAAVAPLLGLLGTVTGMISTFEIITEHGTGDPKLLSGGISEALITTQLGLVVAIPMVLIGNLLNGQGTNALRNCERAAFAFINARAESIPEDGDHETKTVSASEAA